jgi:alpha-L-rhamnosidase
MGATTIWERWDSLLPDGSVNPGEMTSFNHYALGAVADWLHRTVGGLMPAAPGYRHLEIRPCPGGGLTHARARHQTPYGLAECAWRIEQGQITVEASVPPNTRASVTLPGGDGSTIAIGSGRYRWVYPYQAPQPLRRPLTLDSTLGEVIDDPAAWAAVLAVLRRHLPGFADRELGQNGALAQPVRQLFEFGNFPNKEGLLAAIQDALERSTV